MLKDRLATFNSQEFQHDLIQWFKETMRDLPWRQDRDPYRVWVSEVMLQQTRVDTVIPYYERFLTLFPTLEALAEAEEETVLKAWEGLGYYSRARNLQSAVKEVSEHYGGIVPDTQDEITKLKGVGPYTAGAILSIAYNKPEPAVDGNVMRVLARIFLIEDDISKVKTRRLFEQIVYRIISHQNPSYFNQGLMELGALICSPTSPRCSECPVQHHCKAYAEDKQLDLPVKAKKKKPQKKEMAAAVIFHADGSVLIRRRPETGLLAKLWEFPNVETKSKKGQVADLVQYIEDKYALSIEVQGKVQTVEHTFSHLIWHINVFACYTDEPKRFTDDLKWVQNDEIEAFPFPVSHQKIMRQNVVKNR